MAVLVTVRSVPSLRIRDQRDVTCQTFLSQAVDGLQSGGRTFLFRAGVGVRKPVNFNADEWLLTTQSNPLVALQVFQASVVFREVRPL